MCSAWLAASKAAGIETVAMEAPLGLLLSVKDDVELDMIKRASILTNKVQDGDGMSANRITRDVFE